MLCENGVPSILSFDGQSFDKMKVKKQWNFGVLLQNIQVFWGTNYGRSVTVKPHRAYYDLLLIFSTVKTKCAWDESDACFTRFWMAAQSIFRFTQVKLALGIFS